MRRAALALALVALLGAAGCGGGGGKTEQKAAQGPPPSSRELCDRLDLAALTEITGDEWKTAKPARGYVGCEIQMTEDAPGRVYVSVSAIGAGDPSLERQFYREATRFDGFGPNVPGIGDRARFNPKTGGLVVQTRGVIYSVQYLGNGLGGNAKALAPDRKIYALVARQ